MAVVQISRIQVRRGRANSGTGIPQLASGEIAWALDTQELYIGNGSVAEGSPAVGNTKILTENDLTAQGNILTLIQHIYKSKDPTIQTGTSAAYPITRDLQDRLDDRVTSTDFGTITDGNTDDTQALQRAINQLFLNLDAGKASGATADATAARIILELPAGQFKTTDTLYIPSYATIVGAGAEKTVINYTPVSTFTGTTTISTNVLTTVDARVNMIGATITGSGIDSGTTITSVVPSVSITLSKVAISTQIAQTYNITSSALRPAIQFVNDTSDPNVPDDITHTDAITRPRYITLSGLTIFINSSTTAGLQLDAARNCNFIDLNITGNWNDSFNENSRGISMDAKSSLVTCEQNLFNNVFVTGFSYACYAKKDILNNTFNNCRIEDCRQGFVLGAGANGSTIGQQYGPRATQISNCQFYGIKRHAIYIDLGTGNTCTDIKLVNVGNNGGDHVDAAYPQIYIATPRNVVKNINSDRSATLSTVDYASTPYVPEVAGHVTYSSFSTRHVPIGQITNPATCFRLPMSTDAFGVPVGSIGYKIDYIYRSEEGNVTRHGTITVSAMVDSKTAQLTDEYNFTGTTETSELDLDFRVVLLNHAGAEITNPSTLLAPYTISIQYVNSLSNDVASVEYSYTAIS